MNNENKLYYKVLNKYMRSPYMEFQYELNHTYSVYNPELELCENGFHACKEMYEMIIWTNSCNDFKNYRFFECTLGDKIIEGDYNVVSNSITLIREISFEEVDKSIKANIEVLIHDKDVYVKASIAEQGYGLDILLHDEDPFARKAVAKQGYRLDILVHDTHWCVRRAVAEQGYGLDILLHDSDWQVRRAVAEYGYGLDILVNDSDWRVREAAQTEYNKKQVNCESKLNNYGLHLTGRFL